ncbi:MAG: histidinol dehydrogenase [Candidatus Nanopelagicaceae bacterium]|nr:histidinol dehydrogenase [Candidatus Nanopelagicaceae bacterium]
MRTLDLRGQRLSKSGYKSKLPRARLDVKAALAQVEPIIDEVRSGDVSTLLKLSERFDGISPSEIRVPKAKIEEALDKLEPQLRAVIEESIRRVRIVHKEQIRGESTVRVVDGGEVEERWIPVDRVGLYVPAGRAIYPSSVVMNVLPAQLAGVKSIALASPPQRDNDGWPNNLVLATCALLGIDEIYAIGGAQAIAALALGIKDSSGAVISEPVDIVTGPGNIYVAAAKRALRGIVGIDSEAGPTEIAVVADSTAVAKEVAADLISQAEHDTIAAAILITDSLELKDEVIRELGMRVKQTRHNQRVIEALSGEQSAIVLVDDLDQALDVANAYAAEHLELLVSDPVSASKKIRNAGAVFLGRYSPVSLGDYLAGSNHVLPTGGCACHSSGLSVQTFLRGLHFITYNERAFREIAPSVVAFAEAEDLPAHGEAIKARFEL